MPITHRTAADNTFSPPGKIAWNESHVADSVDVSPLAGTNAINITSPTLTNGTGLNILKIKTADTGHADFNFPVQDFAVASGVDNNIIHWGYNPAVGGGREDATEPAFFYTIESDFKTGSNRFMESHMQGIHGDGSHFRNMSFLVDRVAKTIVGIFNADEISLLDSTGANQFIKFAGTTTTGTITVYAGTVFSKVTNNAGWLYQNNAANSVSIEIARVNSSNQVSIAPDGGITIFGGAIYTTIVDSGAASALTLKTNAGAQQGQFSHTASAVNYWDFTGSASAGGIVNVFANGTDTDIAIGLRAKNAGLIYFITGATGTNNGVIQFRVDHTASASRYITVTGSNGGNPTLSVSAGNLAITPAIVAASSITTGAPSGGTAGAWKFGIAASVSPTSPNRTIELDVGGTIYYLHAKTTNN